MEYLDKTLDNVLKKISHNKAPPPSPIYFPNKTQTQSYTPALVAGWLDTHANPYPTCHLHLTIRR